MTSWNMFSEEVLKERKRIRDYGLSNIKKFSGFSANSYKQQAKLELAIRLESEDRIEELERDQLKLMTRLEDLELKLDIAERKK